MKIRTSFVSNSSSSSFIIIGRKLELSAVAALVGCCEVWGVARGRGSSGDCGDFLCKVSPDVYELLEDFEMLKDFEFYRADKTVDLEYANRLEVTADSPLQGESYIFDRDYSSAETRQEVIKWIKR